jgi:hypothetical protein
MAIRRKIKSPGYSTGGLAIEGLTTITIDDYNTSAIQKAMEE